MREGGGRFFVMFMFLLFCLCNVWETYLQIDAHKNYKGNTKKKKKKKKGPSVECR